MIITTEEIKEDGIKYLNINVSNSEVERNPDRVRLCANVKIEEYVKPKTGQWIKKEIIMERDFSTVKTYRDVCSHCGIINVSKYKNYCPNCGYRMFKPQENEE